MSRASSTPVVMRSTLLFLWRPLAKHCCNCNMMAGARPASQQSLRDKSKTAFVNIQMKISVIFLSKLCHKENKCGKGLPK